MGGLLVSKIVILICVVIAAVVGYSLHPLSSAPPVGSVQASVAQSVPWASYIGAAGAIAVGMWLMSKFNTNNVATTVALSLIVGGFSFFVPIAMLKFG
jgi:hypothetical protein